MADHLFVDILRDSENNPYKINVSVKPINPWHRCGFLYEERMRNDAE